MTLSYTVLIVSQSELPRKLPLIIRLSCTGLSLRLYSKSFLVLDTFKTGCCHNTNQPSCGKQYSSVRHFLTEARSKLYYQRILSDSQSIGGGGGGGGVFMWVIKGVGVGGRWGV